ncbi:MAG: tRNA (cytidine(34)-2'-O)-methyltransferase [SAR202 cluster bacterium]|jgi:tRNA (cytidine/uridine-2'-O-)-methyltransferase|nr:MAG: tRNA (cytidine(34)-2'-O)-methyltransferase [SAR202 cluster bacterium]KAA1299493.1 MAG: tRNA (cytidine(34)-2'-O)-methyltransferase [SAR202 cluster bacterium]MQG12198.1 tRNA (cytidine(34)-2'-O)-methyltransferase [SAR202 cluster bacterium]|tara:strand:+ start:10 stop:468 length:459 start_codon:yes stop_codon:yes gene_type:complete
MNIVLFEPEIPHNTGNIIRLCANINADLHLIQPLGFTLSDRNLRRAALDYFDTCNVHIHENFQSFMNRKGRSKVYLTDTKAEKIYTNFNYQTSDTFVFGSESKGIDKSILDQFDSNNKIYIPMFPNIRSLNICNSVSIVAYECWRQSNFIIE